MSMGVTENGSIPRVSEPVPQTQLFCRLISCWQRGNWIVTDWAIRGRIQLFHHRQKLHTFTYKPEQNYTTLHLRCIGQLGPGCNFFPIGKIKHRKNCECCHHHSLFKGHNVIVHILVLNCQKCNQYLKCHVSSHKNFQKL